MAVSARALDEFAFGQHTPEGVDTVVEGDALSGIPEVSRNEKFRVNRILADMQTEDAGQIRALYGIDV